MVSSFQLAAKAVPQSLVLHTCIAVRAWRKAPAKGVALGRDRLGVDGAMSAAPPCLMFLSTSSRNAGTHRTRAVRIRAGGGTRSAKTCACHARPDRGDVTSRKPGRRESTPPPPTPPHLHWASKGGPTSLAHSAGIVASFERSR